jgi:hypothetical protein
LTLVGCDQLDNCPASQDPITVESRPATGNWAGSTDLESLTYESAPWDGPLDAFPPDTLMRFRHDLGFAPKFITTFVSFTSKGTANGEKGDVTENTGNQGRVLCVDAREIILLNDTCEEDFFVRVSAWAVGTESDDGGLCQREIDRL